MAAYPTCNGCAIDKASCARRNSLRSAVKGLGLTSVRFKCADRVSLYQPGERVSVTWPVLFDDEWTNETWPATVIQDAADGKFVIRVDNVDSDYETPASEYMKNASRFAKVSKAKLAKLDEPARNICASCGAYTAEEIAAECYSVAHWNEPTGCLKFAAEHLLQDHEEKLP